MKKVFALFFLLTVFTAISERVFGEEQENQVYYVAIIIDDFGNATKDVEAMIALDIPFTGAIIPGQPNSSEHMEKLIAAGKGVIVHLPMEAKGNNKSWNTPMAISSGLSSDEISERTQAAIKDLPLATGLNNHMGSIATANKGLMEKVISIVNDHNLIMIDSVTTNKSTIDEVCKDLGLNYFTRDVFLDDKGKSVEFVQKRMNEVLEVAKEQGYAVAIGHVGPSGGMNTVRGIESMVGAFEREGVRFVTIDELHGVLHGGQLRRE